MEVFKVWRFAPFVRCGVTWRLVHFAILWLEWLERNARIFKQHSMPREDVAHLVMLRIVKWTSARDEFDSIRAGSIRHNLEAFVCE